ncbi:hypothetical protein OAF27_01170 [Verrucomicrobiales bacterium]|nr:hypothetical protein [Verrucomicrobiales bacterium]
MKVSLKSKLGCSLIVISALTAALIAALNFKQQLTTPRDWSFSGALENGGGPLGLYSAHNNTVAFTPDATHVGYIWIDGSYRNIPKPLTRPKVLTLLEKAELRIRSVDDKSPETIVLLDAMDLRPEGSRFTGLTAQVHPSRDSQFIAGLCGRRLAVVDLETMAHRMIEYEGELFGSFSWLGGDEVAFSTTNGDSLVFWRANINDLPDNRTEVFRQPSLRQDYDREAPDLLYHKWSPKRRYVTLFGYAEAGSPDNLLLDVENGTVHRYKFDLDYQCWKPDDSLLLVNDSLYEPRAVYLIDPSTGEVSDLSDEFRRQFGSDLDVRLVSNQWTPDGAHVLLYTDGGSTAHLRGCIVDPSPFKLIHSQKGILKRSPFPDWVLVQGGNNFGWLNYKNGSTAPIAGWVNDWTWSLDGTHAARIEEGVIQVFEPELP